MSFLLTVGLVKPCHLFNSCEKQDHTANGDPLHSGRLCSCTSLDAATEHNSLDSRSYGLAQAVGAALAAKARACTRDLAQVRIGYGQTFTSITRP